MFEQWKENANSLLDGDPKGESVLTTVFSTLEYLASIEWAGACHAVSAIMHVLLKEQGIDSQICVGECSSKINNQVIFFDHSWLTIDGDIFDVAIYNTLKEVVNAPITFKSKNIDTMRDPEVNYGINYRGLDRVARQISSVPFVAYMDGFPGHSRGLWGFVRKISRNMGLDINIKESDYQRYLKTHWEYVR